MNHSCPAMDATNGSVLNWINTLDALLMRPLQFAVPGHFDIASKADVQSFRDYLATLRDQVTKLVASGASLQQVRDGLQMQKFNDFKQFPQFRATFPDNAAVLFQEISKK